MTGPQTQGSGVDVQSSEEVPRYEWLTADRQAQVRNVLLGLALFAGLVVYVYHSFGPQPRALALVKKLRVVGVMTWLYALVQIADMRFWHSRFAQRRPCATTDSLRAFTGLSASQCSTSSASAFADS